MPQETTPRSEDDLQKEIDALAQAVPLSDPVVHQEQEMQFTTDQETVVADEDQSQYSLKAMRDEIRAAKEKHFGQDVPTDATSHQDNTIISQNTEENQNVPQQEGRSFAFDNSIKNQWTEFGESHTDKIESNPMVDVKPTFIGNEFAPQEPEEKVEPNSLSGEDKDKDDVDPYNFGTFTV